MHDMMYRNLHNCRVACMSFVQHDTSTPLINSVIHVRIVLSDFQPLRDYYKLIKKTLKFHSDYHRNSARIKQTEMQRKI